MKNSTEAKKMQDACIQAGHQTSIRFVTHNGVRDWWMLNQKDGEGKADFVAVGIDNVRECVNQLTQK